VRLSSLTLRVTILSNETTSHIEFVSSGGKIPFTSTSEILRADAYRDNSVPHEVSSETVGKSGKSEAPKNIRIGNG
jgi:hypothetical protein